MRRVFRIRRHKHLDDLTAKPDELSREALARQGCPHALTQSKQELKPQAGGWAQGPGGGVALGGTACVFTWAHGGLSLKHSCGTSHVLWSWPPLTPTAIPIRGFLAAQCSQVHSQCTGEGQTWAGCTRLAHWRCSAPQRTGGGASPQGQSLESGWHDSDCH